MDMWLVIAVTVVVVLVFVSAPFIRSGEISQQEREQQGDDNG